MPIRASVWKKKNVYPRMLESDPIHDIIHVSNSIHVSTTIHDSICFMQEREQQQCSIRIDRIPDVPLSKIKSTFAKSFF